MTATLQVQGLSKRFGQRSVVADVTLSASGGDVLGILGDNGSGKSTVIRMIGGVLRPSSGTVDLVVEGIPVESGQRSQACGIVAPYLAFYDEFSPFELLSLDQRLHGLPPARREASMQVLEQVGLADRCHDTVRTFSSGMRQRVAIALAIHRQPPLLLLDEPSVTLDRIGRTILETAIDLQRRRGAITLLATNDDRERSLCTTTYTVRSVSPRRSSSS